MAEEYEAEGYEEPEFAEAVDEEGDTSPYADLREAAVVEPAPASGVEFDPRLLAGLAVGAVAMVTIVGIVAVMVFVNRGRATPAEVPTVVLSAQPTEEQIVLFATQTPSLTPLASDTPAATNTPAATSTRALSGADLTATITNIPALRYATLSEFKGTVQLKSPAMKDWVIVQRDLTIIPGTTVLTSEGSSVKITLSEGTVIRLGPQTQFTLTELSGTPAEPLTRVKLDFGKIWAIVIDSLGKGSLEVQMPVGTASVRGSFMSAEHNSTDQLEIVTCLETKYLCRYKNSNGSVDLTTGQQTESAYGSAPTKPHSIDKNQIASWEKTRVPEVETLTPTPSNTPTRTATRTASNTFTPSATVPSKTPTPTFTPTPTRTPTPTNTPVTPTLTPVPTNTPGPPTRLAFIVQPPGGTAGATFTVRVAIQDSLGNTVPYATDTVTVAIDTNPSGGTLSGTTSVGTVNGVADFTNLSINYSGVGYTLKATGAFTAATSAAFNLATASLSVSTVSTIQAGTVISSFTVTARNAAAATDAGYRGTIAFTSSDPQATGLPANYTFTAGDAGVRTFSTVTLKTAPSQTVTVTDTVTPALTATANITVTPAPAATLQITGLPASIAVGTPTNVTVTARDAYANIATGYAGTIQFSSTDGAAVLPTNYTFVAGDNGQKTFTNGVTFGTPGSQSVTATDTVTSTITGTSPFVTVT